MEQVAERVFFRADKEAEEETVKVYAVMNMFEDVELLMNVFKLKADAIEYASTEARYNEVDEYVVIEKEWL